MGRASARGFFQPEQSLLIEAMEPVAHHPLTHFELLGDLGGRQALARQPNDLRSFQFASWHLSRMQQLF
jgi:hypothetical protein